MTLKGLSNQFLKTRYWIYWTDGLGSALLPANCPIVLNSRKVSNLFISSRMSVAAAAAAAAAAELLLLLLLLVTARRGATPHPPATPTGCWPRPPLRADSSPGGMKFR